MASPRRSRAAHRGGEGDRLPVQEHGSARLDEVYCLDVEERQPARNGLEADADADLGRSVAPDLPHGKRPGQNRAYPIPSLWRSLKT